MGFLALLTPCVFPMIPITVSFFTKQGEIEDNNPLKSAIIYALGIITIFTSLGLILAITLGALAALQALPPAHRHIGTSVVHRMPECHRRQIGSPT